MGHDMQDAINAWVQIEENPVTKGRLGYLLRPKGEEEE
jgi:hypothetical protein